MSTVLKLSEAASIAFHAMLFVAENTDGPVSAKTIASALDVSEAHLAKVLQRLAGVGLLRSTRGPKGGFTLGKPAKKITLLDVYEAIEGALSSARCLFGTPICDRKQCIFGEILPEVSKRLREHMATKTLFQLAKGGSISRAKTQENRHNR